MIMVTIVMQGIVEPLRYVRVFWPWTYFGGPMGIEGDPERWVILTGSPQWYCLYLAALCALGVVVALLHDREQPREGLKKLAAALVVVALALGTLSMTMGVQEMKVNPLPSPAAEECRCSGTRPGRLPWPLLGAAALLLFGLLRIVQQWPYTMWPLQGVAVGLLAGVAPSPMTSRPPRWSTRCPAGWPGGPRPAASACCCCSAGGWLVVALTADAYFGHAADVAWQGVAATVAVVAAVDAPATAWLGRPGEPRVATGVRRRGGVPRAGPTARGPAAAVPVPRRRHLGRPASTWWTARRRGWRRWLAVLGRAPLVV